MKNTILILLLLISTTTFSQQIKKCITVEEQLEVWEQAESLGKKIGSILNTP